MSGARGKRGGRGGAGHWWLTGERPASRAWRASRGRACVLQPGRLSCGSGVPTGAEGLQLGRSSRLGRGCYREQNLDARMPKGAKWAQDGGGEKGRTGGTGWGVGPAPPVTHRVPGRCASRRPLVSSASDLERLCICFGLNGPGAVLPEACRRGVGVLLELEVGHLSIDNLYQDGEGELTILPSECDL